MSFRLLRVRKAILFGLLFLSTTQVLAGTPVSSNIKFDVNLANAGNRQASDVLRTNVVAYVSSSIPKTTWDKFLKEQRVGDVLIDTIDISRDSRDFADLKRRIRERGQLVKSIVDAGGRVQLVFQHGIPRWLSSDPNNKGDLFQGGLSQGIKIWHSVPPSDYKVWEEVAYEFVNYFNNQLKTNGQVYYVVGNEPENYWVGTEEEWHRYYEYFVRGALRADPNAKIGGINTSGIRKEKFHKYNPQKRGKDVVFQDLPAKGSQGMVYNWLEYSAKKGLPVDIVTWHDYPAASPIPSETANWVLYEKQIQEWLTKFGYRNTELILNDWPEWMPVPYENDSEFQAAYVVSSLISMITHTRVKPLYLGMVDIGAYSNGKDKRENASFAGGNGMFTSIGLAKPVYNAYALMSKMKGKLVNVQTGDEFVRAMASIDGDDVYLLLTNFIPSERVIAQNSFSSNPKPMDEEEKSAIRRVVKRTGKNRKQLIASFLNGSANVGELDLPPALEKNLKEIKKVHLEGQKRMQAPAEVSIKLTGFRPTDGKWQSDVYVIDRRHANSYSVRKKLAEQANVRGVAKNKRELRKLVEEANARTGFESGLVEEKNVSIRNGVIEWDTQLEPNSVQLVVLSRNSAR